MKDNERKILWETLSENEKQLVANIEDDYGLYDDRSEKIVLGAVLGSQQLFYHVEGLRSEHFHDPLNQQIWSVVCTLVQENTQFDAVLVASACRRNFVFRAIGGEDKTFVDKHIATIVAAGACTPDIRGHVSIIVDLWQRRQLCRALRKSYIATRDTTLPSIEVVNDIMAQAMEIGEKNRDVCIRTLAQVGYDIVKDMDKPLPATPTKINGLDGAMAGGLYPRRTYCIAARPKRGKTLLMGTIHYNVAMQGIPAAYICCEMGDREIHQRFLGRFMGKNCSSFYRKHGDASFVSEVMLAQKESSKIPGYYADCPGLTFDALKRLLMSLHQRYKIKGFFLDYLGKIQGKGKNQNRSEFEEDIADWLHAFCKKNDIWGVYACQLNRDGNLRGSDGALMGADQVYRLDKEDDGKKAWMIQLASRYGAKQGVGSGPGDPGLIVDPLGPFYRDFDPETDNPPAWASIGLHGEQDYVVM